MELSHTGSVNMALASLAALRPAIPHLSSVVSPLSRTYLFQNYDFNTPALGLRYKSVDRKVRPVPMTLPEAAQPKRRFPEDPLQSLPPMNPFPPPITHFSRRLTKDRWEALQLRERSFLWEEEVQLAFDVLMKNEAALAWDDAEKGRFREDYFSPTVVPTVKHEPWALKNILIPHGMREPIVKFIKDKIASGTYEPSGSSYRSQWFCVPKKNGSFRIVHDLQPLNAITIKDAGVPPNVEPYAEHAAGRAIYTLGDLFTGFDHASVVAESRDLFTFQTPLGPHHLTCLPMGWTNSVAIFQGHVSFILQDEIDKAPPCLDDIPVLGPQTHYEQANGTYETIPSNPKIRRFVWEHLVDVNRIFHQHVTSAPALCPIDYQSGRQVIVAVDSSHIAVGWIVFQLDSKLQRKPARYGSIAWNEREARYSQAKVELFGLYGVFVPCRCILWGCQGSLLRLMLNIFVAC